MRSAIVAVSFLLTAACVTRRTSPAPNPLLGTQTIGQYLSESGARVPTFCVIDEKEADCNDVLKAGPGTFKRLQLLSGGSATGQYGSRARDGVLAAFTKL